MEFYQLFIEATFWKKVELIFLVLFFAALLWGIAFAIHEKAHEIYKKTRLALYELFPKPSARSDMPPDLWAFVALRDREIAELAREKRWNIVKSILYIFGWFPGCYYSNHISYSSLECSRDWLAACLLEGLEE